MRGTILRNNPMKPKPRPSVQAAIYTLESELETIKVLGGVFMSEIKEIRTALRVLREYEKSRKGK